MDHIISKRKLNDLRDEENKAHNQQIAKESSWLRLQLDGLTPREKSKILKDCYKHMKRMMKDGKCN